MPYNELIVTTEDGNNALNRAAAELSPNGAVVIASEIHRLDNASSLVEVLDWLLDAARRVAGDARLFVVRGSSLRAWRDAPADPDQLSSPQRVALNVGGRVVAVLAASSSNEAAAATIDILASYASRSLESMTLHKALGLVPPRVPKMSSELI